MKYKINEIFYSIQGEGYWTGTAAIFIRFSGCNLKCWFCDTKHESGGQMSIDDILLAIKAYPARHVVLTGGEPTLQADKALYDALKLNGYYVQIETNGTSTGIYADWITCSPKENRILDWGDELKVVFTGQELEPYEKLHFNHFYLQPCSMEFEPVINIIKERPKWRLSLQTQKMLKIA